MIGAPKGILEGAGSRRRKRRRREPPTIKMTGLSPPNGILAAGRRPGAA